MLGEKSSVNDKSSGENVPVNVPVNVLVNCPVNVSAGQRLEEIINFMKSKPEITVVELAQVFGVNEKTISRDISKLKNKDKIRRIGSDKTGHWEVLK